MSHESATGHHQVGTCTVESLVDEEVFLLPSQKRVDMLYLGVEISGYGCGGLVNAVEGS